MPTFTHGRKAELSVDGTDISDVSTDANHNRSKDTAESSTLGTDDKQYVPGMKDETLACTVRFDATKIVTLEAAYDADGSVPIIWYPEGNVAGKRSYTFQGILTQLDINASTGDVVGGQLSIQRTGPTTPATIA